MNPGIGHLGTDPRLVQRGEQIRDHRSPVGVRRHRHPFHDLGAATAIRPHPLYAERGPVDTGDDQWRLAAAHHRQHPIDEPVDHRVQRRQVADGRPQRRGRLARCRELLFGDHRIGGQAQPLGDAQLGQVALRKRRQPPHQVVRRHHRQERRIGVVGAKVEHPRIVHGDPQRLGHELVVRREQRRRPPLGHFLEPGSAGQQGHEVERLRRPLGHHRVNVDAVAQRLGDRILLETRGMKTHQRPCLTERPVRLELAGQQLGQHPGVATDPSVVGAHDQRPNIGGVLLAVAVDSAVPLLDRDERPGEIEVDQVVTLPMQVDAFGCHVAGQQQANRRLGETELTDHVHLLHVGQPAVQHPDGVGPEAHHRGELAGQPVERRDALGEHHDPRRRTGADADVAQLVGERHELGGRGVVDCLGERAEPRQRRVLRRLRAIRVGVRCGAQRPAAVGDRLGQRPVRAQRRLEQGPGEQARARA